MRFELSAYGAHVNGDRYIRSIMRAFLNFEFDDIRPSLQLFEVTSFPAGDDNIWSWSTYQRDKGSMMIVSIVHWA